MDIINKAAEDLFKLNASQFIYKESVMHFLNQKIESTSIKDLLYFGIKYSCEESCTCHTECKKADKILNQ